MVRLGKDNAVIVRLRKDAGQSRRLPLIIKPLCQPQDT
jgi:hypothetical protein